MQRQIVLLCVTFTRIVISSIDMAKHQHTPHTPPEGEADDIMRFGVSMASQLLGRFDELIEKQGYTNRSEAIRDLVRDRLVEAEWEADKGRVVGAVVLVYDHEMRTLGDRLTGLQHQLGHLVISSMHVHLDDRDCLEVVVMKGSGDEVRKLADRLLSLKGVKHGRLMMTGTG